MNDSFEDISRTPPPTTYELAAFVGNDVANQQLALTREEYIALKEHLIELRGLRPSN
jgi:hypothetical protein